MFNKIKEKIRNKVKGMCSIEVNLTRKEQRFIIREAIAVVKEMRIEFGQSFTDSLLKPYTEDKNIRESLINIGILFKLSDAIDQRDTTEHLLSTENNKCRLEEAYKEMEKMKNDT
jgi:hypothetical protein